MNPLSTPLIVGVLNFTLFVCPPDAYMETRESGKKSQSRYFITESGKYNRYSIKNYFKLKILKC